MTYPVSHSQRGTLTQVGKPDSRPDLHHQASVASAPGDSPRGAALSLPEWTGQHRAGPMGMAGAPGPQQFGWDSVLMTGVISCLPVTPGVSPPPPGQGLRAQWTANGEKQGVPGAAPPHPSFASFLPCFFCKNQLYLFIYLFFRTYLYQYC